MKFRLVSTIAIVITSTLLPACGNGSGGGSGTLPMNNSRANQSVTTGTSTSTTTLQWHAGGSRAGMPTSSLDTAQASNGDRVVLQGSGTFSGCFAAFGTNCAVAGGTITGGGKYAIENATGTIRGHGTFSVVSPFTSFIGFGPPVAGSSAEGGQLITPVHLVSDTGGRATATLTVDCELGHVTISPFSEGIFLNVSGGLNYDKSIRGFTIFAQ